MSRAGEMLDLQLERAWYIWESYSSAGAFQMALRALSAGRVLEVKSEYPL